MVKPSVLRGDLEELESRLKIQEQELAVKTDTIQKYYRLSIAHCQITKNEIIVMVRIPIVEKGTKISMYEPIPIQFQFGEEICQTKLEKSLVVHDENTRKSTVISGYALQMCDGKEPLCALTNNIIDQGTMCTKKAFAQKQLSEIKRACFFECQKKKEKCNEEAENLPIVQEVEQTAYVITSITGYLEIGFANSTREKIEMKKMEIGALYIKIPCSAKLFQVNGKGENKIISMRIPCSRESHEGKPQISRLLPTQWCKLPDQVIEDDLRSRHTYAEDSHLVDNEWKLTSLTTQLQTEKEFEKKIERMIYKHVSYSPNFITRANKRILVRP
jgi:hypothetical protein